MILSHSFVALLSTLEIHFMFFMNEFREGTYTRALRGLVLPGKVSPGLEGMIKQTIQKTPSNLEKVCGAF
jgi:hypothetical protein